MNKVFNNPHPDENPGYAHIPSSFFTKQIRLLMFQSVLTDGTHSPSGLVYRSTLLYATTLFVIRRYRYDMVVVFGKVVLLGHHLWHLTGTQMFPVESSHPIAHAIPESPSHNQKAKIRFPCCRQGGRGYWWWWWWWRWCYSLCILLGCGDDDSPVDGTKYESILYRVDFNEIRVPRPGWDIGLGVPE